MTTDDHEAESADGSEWAADEQDVRGRTEKLVSQLAALYNENTLLRERVRALEKEMRKASKRG
jgi:hypothetical protein